MSIEADQRELALGAAEEMAICVRRNPIQAAIALLEELKHTEKAAAFLDYITNNRGNPTPTHGRTIDA